MPFTLDQHVKRLIWWSIVMVLSIGLYLYAPTPNAPKIPKKALSTSLEFVYLGFPQDLTKQKLHNRSNKKLTPLNAIKESIDEHPFISLTQKWDQELATYMARSWDKSPIFTPLPTLKTIDTYLIANPGAIAIGVPEHRSASYINLPAYRKSRLMLIAPKRSPFPETLSQPPSIIEQAIQEALPSLPSTKNAPPALRTAILSSNPHAQSLENTIKGYPDVQLSTLKTDSIRYLIQLIKTKEADSIFVEQSDWTLLKYAHPNWEVKLILEDLLHIGWRVSSKISKEKQASIKNFLHQAQKDRTLLALAEKFRIDDTRLDNQDILYFEKRKKTRLPKLIPAFSKAAEITMQPPYLLMALSYQESHWDETQVSHTGARGLMMINAITAEYLKLPPNPSIEEQVIAGAKYLKILRDNLAPIPEPDRTLIALAGYNIGPGALSRILRKFIRQYSLFQSVGHEEKIPLPPHLSRLINSPDTLQKQELEEAKKAPRLIRLDLTPAEWKSITWPRIRYFITQESMARRISSQPIILTERVRIFRALLEGQNEYLLSDTDY